MKRLSSGFTFLELLVSLTISAFVLVTAGVLVRHSLAEYDRTTNRVFKVENARMGWHQLHEDLRAAQFFKGSFAENGGDSHSRVGFFRSLSHESQSFEQNIADLGAVYYYISDQEIQGRVVRCLMRGIRESKDTFEALKSDNTAAIFSNDPELDEPLMLGVVGFQCIAKRWDGGWIEWSASDDEQPSMVEIRLYFLNPEQWPRHRTSQDWDVAGMASKFVRGMTSETHPEIEEKMIEIHLKHDEL